MALNINEPCAFYMKIDGINSFYQVKLIIHVYRNSLVSILKGGLRSQCINCRLTGKHLLIECADPNDVRQRFYQGPGLQDLETVTVDKIVSLQCLKPAALYTLL